MKKSRLIVLLPILIVLALSLSASLQQSPTFVIVNSQRVFESSNKGQQILKMKDADAGKKAVQEFRSEVVTTIESMAKDRGYDLVLDFASAGVVYFNPAVDITDEVIRRINQLY
jgi:Skp family chaperone for outer membrane proteins